MKELEVEIGDYDSILINSGGIQPVVIRKEYGPTVCDSIRVRLDLSTWEWVFAQSDDEVDWFEVGRSPSSL